MSVARWLASAAFLGLGCGRTAIEGFPDGCTTDLECKEGRICVNGSCEDSPVLVTSGGRSGNGGSSSAAGGGHAAGAGAGGAAGVAGGSATAGGSGDGGSGVTVGENPIRVDVGAVALAADPLRGRLYAIVGADAKAHANELVVIDPEHATILASVLIGPGPYLIAVSEDATRLWVGRRGPELGARGFIREVDLTTWPPEPGNEYAVPSLANHAEDTYAVGMAALPGRAESLALSLSCPGCGYSDFAVVDAGVPRPTDTEYTMAYQPTVGPPGFLFSFNDRSSSHEFSSARVDDSGVHDQILFHGLLDGFDTLIQYDAGFVIASSGQVLDVGAPESPVRAGTFAYQGEVVPHAERDKVVMLSYAEPPSFSSNYNLANSLILRLLRLSTFQADLERPLAGGYATVYEFVEAKPGIFAFIELRSIGVNPMSPASFVHLFAAPDVEN